MRAFISLIIGALAGTILGGVGTIAVIAVRSKPDRAPVPAVEIPDPLSRFADAITAGDKVCGPVPFEIEITRDSIKYTCGRPMPITKAKVQGPAKIAEGQP